MAKLSKQEPQEVSAGPGSAQKSVEQVISDTASTNSNPAEMRNGTASSASHPSNIENGNIKPSTDNVSEKSLSPSPNSRKRALDETTKNNDTPSKNKKARGSSDVSSPLSEDSRPPRFPSPPDQPATKFDKETWLGFCDIESEPAYFSVILREMGVSGVAVREVVGLDADSLAMMPQPIYGLIFLFGYREFGVRDPDAVYPNDMWFANQMPAHNSCATLAMINILMNSPDVDVGEHLTQFKEFTQGFEGYERGEALASFDFVRKIHNSFAKKMDILEADKHLHYKVHNREPAETAKEEDDFEDDFDEFKKDFKKAKKTQPVKQSTKSATSRPTRSTRAASAEMPPDEEHAKNFEARAHHYVAFIPHGNEAWKLDGLDGAPICMGPANIDAGQTWLDPTSDAIRALMHAEEDPEQKNNFAVFGLMQSPLISLRTRASTAFRKLHSVEAQLSIAAPAWRDTLTDEDAAPPSPTLLGIVEDVVVAAPDAAEEPENPVLLLDQRANIIRRLHGLAELIMLEVQNEADEDTKATQRRFDYGPAIQKWCEMLAENGFLEENMPRFKEVAV